MARDAELRARITAEDEASPVIEKVAEAAQALEGKDAEVTVEADTAEAEAGLEEVTADVDELEGTTAEVAVDADTDAATAGLEEVTGEVDALDGQTAEVTVDADTDAAESALNNLGDTASSVLSGLPGQAAGAFAGLSSAAGAGAAGAAGALATFAASAIGSFSDVALAAGEMSDAIGLSAEDSSRLIEVVGDIGVSADTVQGAIGRMNRAAEDTPDKFDKIGASIQRSDDGAIDVMGTFLNVVDTLDQIPDAAERAAAGQEIFGRGWMNIAELIEGGADGVREAMAGVEDAKVISDEQITKAREFRDRMDALKGVFEEFAIYAGEAIADVTAEFDTLLTTISGGRDLDVGGIFNAGMQSNPITDGLNKINAGLQALTGGAEESETTWTALWDGMKAAATEGGNATEDAAQQSIEAMKEWAAQQEKLAQATEDYNAIVSSSDWGKAAIEGAAAGAEAFADQQFGLVNIAAEAEAAYDGLNAAIEKNGFTFDLNTQAGRANADVIQDLYKSQIPGMANAFATADGNIDTFAAGMDELRTNVMQQVRDETELTEDQIGEVVDQMGLVPGNVSSQFEMLGLETANSKLAMLSGVLSSLPPSVQREVTLAVLAGDPQAALAAIEAEVSSGAPPEAELGLDPGAAIGVAAFVSTVEKTTVTAPLDADPSDAEDEVAGFKRTSESTKPVVPVDSNTKAAIDTMMYLKIVAMLMKPEVTVTANTFPARLAIAALGMMNPRPPVDAYLRDYPSASEIAARIGTVRVPIDAYIRTMPRIDGG